MIAEVNLFSYRTSQQRNFLDGTSHLSSHRYPDEQIDRQPEQLLE
jgi:hypothetical protein